MEAISTETVIVEIGQGHARTRERIGVDADARSFTIGRSVACDVTIDDDYAAPEHVRIELATDGRLLATDLGSRNGIVVDGRRYDAKNHVVLTDGQLRVGRTLIRIRTAAETLGAEKPLTEGWSEHGSIALWSGLAGGAAVLAESVYSVWVTAPVDPVASYASSILFTCAAFGAWASTWSLLTRILLGQWRWFEHAGVALAVSAAWYIADAGLDLVWFAFSWSARGSRFAIMFGAIIVAGLIYQHMRLASNVSRRHAAAAVGAAFTVIALAGLWYSERELAKNVGAVAGMPNRIYPDAFRLKPAQSLDTFMLRAARLRIEADGKRDRLPAQEGGEDESE